MKLTKEKEFYKTLFVITLPIMLQNIISTGVGLMDTIMLGQLGDLAISASSLAGQPFFIYQLIIMGLSCGAAVLMAQYWGREDIPAIRKVMAIVLRVALVVAIIATFIAAAFPEAVMSVFSKEQDVIEAGAEYLRIVAFSYFFYGLSAVFLQVMRSVEKVVMSMVIYGISFFINVFFNYMFIFGEFGAPEMGIAGAAVGTLLARISEFLMTIIYIVFFEKRICLRLRDLITFDSEMTNDFVRHSIPVVINEVLWGMGMSVHAVILGHIGKSVVTANSICGVIQQLALVIIFGVSSSAGVLIGKAIGAGQIEKVRSYAFTIQMLSVGLGIVSMAAVFFARGAIISIYNIEPATKVLANQLMAAYAVLIFFQCSIIPSIMGTLRGGGDGKFVLYIDLLTMYLIAIPLGYFAAFQWGLPMVAVCMILKIDEPIKMLVTFWRLKGTKWIRNLTRSEVEAV